MKPRSSLAITIALLASFASPRVLSPPAHNPGPLLADDSFDSSSPRSKSLPHAAAHAAQQPLEASNSTTSIHSDSDTKEETSITCGTHSYTASAITAAYNDGIYRARTGQMRGSFPHPFDNHDILSSDSLDCDAAFIAVTMSYPVVSPGGIFPGPDRVVFQTFANGNDALCGLITHTGAETAKEVKGMRASGSGLANEAEKETGPGKFLVCS